VPEEWRRLELELPACSMGTRQSSSHGQLDQGMTRGAGSMVWSSHGWGGRCRLCFDNFLQGRLGGWQLDVRAMLGEVRPETHVRLLWWPARRSLMSRTSSSSAAGEERTMQRQYGDGNRMAQRGGENETGLSVESNRRAAHMAVAV
jgi:hypothetical protein